MIDELSKAKEFYNLYHQLYQGWKRNFTIQIIGKDHYFPSNSKPGTNQWPLKAHLRS